MTKNFNTLVENILSDLEAAATLTPVGQLTVATDDDEDCFECDGQEEIAEEISETEIAQKIIQKAKKLRKKIGEDSYHYIRTIIDLAEKLLEMHPEVEIIEPVGESFKDEVHQSMANHEQELSRLNYLINKYQDKVKKQDFHDEEEQRVDLARIKEYELYRSQIIKKLNHLKTLI